MITDDVSLNSLHYTTAGFVIPFLWYLQPLLVFASTIWIFYIV